MISLMSFTCQNCLKKTTFGSSQTHGRGIAGKRWKKRAQMTLRTFKPNLQKVSVFVTGKKMQMMTRIKTMSEFNIDFYFYSSEKQIIFQI